MSWKAKTFCDVHGLPFNPRVKAPCCTRTVAADTLVDARMQPAELRPRGEEFHCDGCRERLFIPVQFGGGGVSRVEYWARHNPPAEFMDALRAREG